MLFRKLRAARRQLQPLLKKLSFRPELEFLEARWLPSGITVQLLNDTSGGAGISSNATIRGWITDAGYSIADKEVWVEPTSTYPEVWVTDANGYFEVAPNTTPSQGTKNVHVAWYDHADNYIEASFSFVYDSDAPSVTLTAPTASDNGNIWLTVGATDSTTVSTTVAVDTSANGTSWTQVATPTVTWTSYSAGFELSPALSSGTTYVRVRATDQANNVGISASKTVVVTSNPTTWTVTGQARGDDPAQATRVPFGTVSVAPHTGSLRLSHELDFDASPGTVVGLQPSLTYNSDSINVKPIIEGALLVSNTAEWRVLTVQVQLTFNGSTQSWVSYGSFNIAPNANFTVLVAAQAASPVTSTGVYPWKLRIRANPYYSSSDNPLIERAVTGSTAAVVLDQANPIGPGWSLSGVDRLVPYSAGVVWVYGAGGSRAYASAGGGTFSSPANDPGGTLVQNGDNTYTYTYKDQSKVHFTSAGLLSRRVDAHNVALTYTHDSSSRLIGVSTPDGGLTTLTYSNNLLATITEPGGRTVTLTHDATRQDLTLIQDVDGALRTLTYDTQTGALHRLLTDAWEPLRSTMVYDSKGAVTSLDRGLDSTLQVNPAVYRGLLVGSNPPAYASQQGLAVLTDAKSQLTTYTLDALGRQTQLQTPDGATQTWQLDAAGRAVVWSDGLQRVTTYTFAYGSGKGDLTGITLPDGSSQEFQYDSTFHTLTRSRDTLGRYTTYTLDAQTGDVLTIRDALNQVTTQTWSGGLQTSITNPRGYTTSFVFDSARRLQATVDALGGRTTVVYDSNGNVRTMQDALQRVTTTVLDGRSRLLQQVDAAGGVQTWTYLASGPVAAHTDARGVETQYTYDQVGGVTRVIQAAGTASQVITSYTHDKLVLVTSATDGMNHSVTLTYDPLGRVKTQTSAVQAVDTLTYDLAGQRVRAEDPLGHVTSFTYNVRGWRTEVRNPLGEVSTTVYDTEGNVVASVDARGNRTTTIYDNLNRPVQTVDAAGGLSTIVYDTVGNPVVAIDPRGNRTTPVYDSLNRPIARTDPLGHTVTTVYDAVGNKVRAIDSLGNATTMIYDVLNRVVRVEDAGGGVVTTVYDANGNVVRTIDALAQTTTHIYDLLNRRTQTIDPRGGIVTVVYDSVGNVTALVDPIGNRTTQVYDSANRLVETIDPTGHSTSYSYDLAGRQTATTDRLGRYRQFVYDDADRLIREIWKSTPAGSTLNTLTYTHDAAGNRVSAADQNGTYTMTYDGLNRVTRVQEPFGVSLTYSYDAASNSTRVEDSFGAVETSTYDAANRLTNRELANSGQASIRLDLSYNARNELTGVTRNQGPAPIQQIGTSSYTYDSVGRQSSVQHRNASGTLLANDTMTYDVASRLTGQTTHGYATVTVRRSGGSAGPATVDYATSAGSATAGQDYASTSGTVSFADGEVSKTFTIPMLDDTANEGDETINLTLSNVTGATLGTPSSAVLTLVEDENTQAGSLQLSASTYSVGENDGTATITVNRTGGSTGTVTVNYATSNGTATAGQDYTSTSGTLTFLAGEVSKTFTIPLLPDDAQEGNETVTLTLSSAGGGASLGSPSTATLTIVDADPEPTGSRFDFGTTTSPLASGYTRVSETTAYTATQGYGWLNSPTLLSYDRATGDDLKRDLIQVVADATFAVDVANGTYRVGLTLGDNSGAYDQMGVYLEGVLVDTFTLNSGQFVQPTYTVTVSDGQLSLRLKDLGGSSTFVVINGMELVALPAGSLAFSVANLSVSENGRSTTPYSYDSTNQLTGDGTAAYSYDLNGNRTLPGYQTGAGNRLTSDGTWAYTYDHEGNLSKKSKAVNRETWTYGYDHRNHMIWAEKRATDGGTLQMRADYKYDVFGRRIEKAVDPDGAGAQGTMTSRFAYLGQEVWADLNGSNALQTRYLHGDVVDQLFARLAANGTAAWYLTDLQGSVTDVTDESGAVLDHIDYETFGNVLSENNPTFGDRYKYTAREFDAETGLLYYRARYYDPRTGRWTTEDPERFNAGDSNLYRYVQNSPTNAVDPWGRWIITRNSDNAIASAVAEEGDTIDTLADAIGLDPTDFHNWLSVLGEDPDLVANWKIKLADGSEAKIADLLRSDKIVKGQGVGIPNLIYALWMDVGGLGQRIRGWPVDMDYLHSLGFAVRQFNYESLSDNEKANAAAKVLAELDYFSRTKALHGFFVWGHGGPDRNDRSTEAGLQSDDRKFNLAYRAISEKLRYKLGLTILNVCYGSAGKRWLAAENSKGTIFKGREGVIFSPVAIGKWSPFHTWEVIKPGQQGTNPKAKNPLPWFLRAP